MRACSAACSARPGPEARPIETSPTPAPSTTERTSAKSTLISWSVESRPAIPMMACRATSSAAWKVSTNAIPSGSSERSRSLETGIRTSTSARNSSTAASATSARAAPSKPKGVETTAITTAPCARASRATAGAAPEPVPPPIPAVTKTKSAPATARATSSCDSCTASLPRIGSPPAPSPRSALLPSCTAARCPPSAGGASGSRGPPTASAARSACASVFRSTRSTEEPVRARASGIRLTCRDEEAVRARCRVDWGRGRGAGGVGLGAWGWGEAHRVAAAAADADHLDGSARRPRRRLGRRRLGRRRLGRRRLGRRIDHSPLMLRRRGRLRLPCRPCLDFRVGSVRHLQRGQVPRARRLRETRAKAAPRRAARRGLCLARSTWPGGAPPLPRALLRRPLESRRLGVGRTLAITLAPLLGGHLDDARRGEDRTRRLGAPREHALGRAGPLGGAV